MLAWWAQQPDPVGHDADVELVGTVAEVELEPAELRWPVWVEVQGAASQFDAGEAAFEQIDRPGHGRQVDAFAGRTTWMLATTDSKVATKYGTASWNRCGRMLCSARCPSPDSDRF
jgi:hypothetical protein